MTWWIWVTLGIVLIIFEVLFSSFILLWLGVSAVIIGLVDFFIYLNFSTQLFLWSFLSVLLLFFWFNYFRKTWRSTIGQSNSEYVNIKGKVLEIKSDSSYLVRFELPVLGDRIWTVESKQKLNVDDGVVVDSVHGQIIRVNQINIKGVKK